jgi:hypothetical protein
MANADWIDRATAKEYWLPSKLYKSGRDCPLEQPNETDFKLVVTGNENKFFFFKLQILGQFAIADTGNQYIN